MLSRGLQIAPSSVSWLELLARNSLNLGMSSAFYRREANRYRLLAANADRQQVEQFRRMAAECDDLADDLDGGNGSLPSVSASSNTRYFAWPLLRGGA